MRSLRRFALAERLLWRVVTPPHFCSPSGAKRSAEPPGVGGPCSPNISAKRPGVLSTLPLDC